MLDMIAMLGREGITDRARLVVEKPFGLDLESARELDAALKEVVDEEQVFRIDHFLGKEAVQNILALRFANGLFEPAWNRRSIASVQIDVPEEIDIQGRGSFYEGTGCLRDMISTHLFQLLGFVALEDPGAFKRSALRDAKSAGVRAARAARPGPGRLRPVRRLPRRGGRRPRLTTSRPSSRSRPTSTTTGGAACRSTCAPASRSRRAAAPSRCASATRPATGGRPFHGRRRPGPNELVLQLTDEPQISLEMRAKKPGPDMELVEAVMKVDFAQDFPHDDPLEAYERLILDVLRGDRTLFTRSDEVERLWEVCQPLLDDPPEVLPYDKGSWGPQAALDLPEGGWRLGS